MTEARHGLYCNTVTVPTTQPSWALDRALGARMGVLGAQAGAEATGARARAGVRARAGARAWADAQAAGAQGRAERRRAQGVGGAQAGRRQHVRQAQQAQAGHRRGRRRRHAGREAWARGRGLGVPVRAGWACWLGQLGQVGAQCTWLNSDSVFGTSLTQYCS